MNEIMIEIMNEVMNQIMIEIMNEVMNEIVNEKVETVSYFCCLALDLASFTSSMADFPCSK